MYATQWCEWGQMYPLITSKWISVSIPLCTIAKLQILLCRALVLEMFSGTASKQCNADYFSPCSPLLSWGRSVQSNTIQCGAIADRTDLVTISRDGVKNGVLVQHVKYALTDHSADCLPLLSKGNKVQPRMAIHPLRPVEVAQLLKSQQPSLHRFQSHWS